MNFLYGDILIQKMLSVFFPGILNSGLEHFLWTFKGSKSNKFSEVKSFKIPKN